MSNVHVMDHPLIQHKNRELSEERKQVQRISE